MQQIVTNSAQETEAFAAQFAKTLRGPVVVAFFGGLGMGKTAFTRGLAKGLGIAQEQPHVCAGPRIPRRQTHALSL